MDGRVITPEELAQATRIGNSMSPVFRIDAKTVVKTGDCVRLAEAEAMKLVREKTTIPVPKVYNAYINNATGHPLIVMDFIEGDCLVDIWDGMDDEQKQHVTEQLRDHLSQLRKIEGSFIGSVDGTACEDPLFTDDLGAYGPYENEAMFNQGIVKALKDTLSSGWVDTVCNMAMSMEGHKIVMTHSDLSPRNIIVQGSKVVAILDWEYSGYYPDYWEYVKAFYRPAWESEWMKNRAVDRILEPYLTELAVFLHVNSIGAWY